MKDIIKTGFVVSMISYIVFIFFDYIRPGFVSNVFSVHLFLLVAILLFIFSLLSNNEKIDLQELTGNKTLLNVLKFLFGLVIGVILFILVWNEGSIFEDFRVFLALIAFMIPFISYYSLRR